MHFAAHMIKSFTFFIYNKYCINFMGFNLFCWVLFQILPNIFIYHFSQKKLPVSNHDIPGTKQRFKLCCLFPKFLFCSSIFLFISTQVFIYVWIYNIFVYVCSVLLKRFFFQLQLLDIPKPQMCLN